MSLVKSFFSFSFGNLVVAVLSFISTPIITRLVGTESFGQSTLLSTISTLSMFVIMFGLDQAYLRFYHEERKELRDALLLKVMIVPMLLNFLTLASFLIFYKPLSKAILGQEAFIPILMLGILNILVMINRFGMVYVRLRGKSILYSVIHIFGKLVYVAGIFVFFYIYGDNYNVVYYATIGSVAIACVVLYFTCKQPIKKAIKIRSVKSQIKMREVYKYATPFIISSAVFWILQFIDRFFIKFYMGDSDLGIYSAAFTIMGILNITQTMISAFFAPLAYKQYKKNPKHKKLYTQINSIASMVMILIAVMLIMFRDVIGLLLGEEFRYATVIFPYMLISPIMNVVSETTVIGIMFKKKTSYNMVISIIASLINVILNVILIPILGLVGAAMATAVAYIAFFAMRTIISQMLYKVNYNLKTYTFCNILLLITATYATFVKTDIIMIIMCIVTGVLTFILYRGRDQIKLVIRNLKGKLKH